MELKSIYSNGTFLWAWEKKSSINKHERIAENKPGQWGFSVGLQWLVACLGKVQGQQPSLGLEIIFVEKRMKNNNKNLIIHNLFEDEKSW